MADIDELKKKLEDGWIKGEPYVFVSYASKDKEKVYEFVYELRKRGINVYIDIELQENISKNWLQNIKERLYDVDCVAMISFLSLNYFRSYACLIEQLVTRSEDLKMEKGKYLENFYIALDDNMSTIQKMEDAVYNNTVAKESQSMAIKMVPEEVNVLKDVMEDNIAVKSKLKKDVRSTIDGLNTAHRVAISMLSYIFKESSYSIQKYGTAGDCAQLMYNNFTNDKNDKINMMYWRNLKKSTTMLYHSQRLHHLQKVRIVPLYQQFRIIRQKLTLRMIGLLIIFRVQSIAMWQIIMIQIAMK